MFLNNIIEAEDYEALTLLDTESLDPLTQEIIIYIMKHRTFSAYDIGKNLSIKHAAKYLDLCDGRQIIQVKKNLHNHIVKIQNEEL